MKEGQCVKWDTADCDTMNHTYNHADIFKIEYYPSSGFEAEEVEASILFHLFEFFNINY